MSNVYDLLTQAIIILFEEERFYAEIVLQMDRKFSSTAVPTAGVRILDRVELVINPEFFESLTKQERVSILKHECGHILNDHIPRFKEMAPDVYNESKNVEDKLINRSKHIAMNIAADCALNCNIKNLPENCQLPKNYNLKDYQTFEWYMEHLKDHEKLKDLTEYDGHSLWSESKDNRDIIKEKLRQAINNAANKTRGAGKMTGNDEMLVSRLNHKTRDWKADIRRFVARQIETLRESSRRKRNRRYGISVPGEVKHEVLHLGVAIDTSGSISDEALNQFMAEIANIAKYAKVTVVEADSEVKNSYVFDPKKTYKIQGRGGTAYQPAFDYFTKETDVDGVIYFGDMDAYDVEKLKKPKYPVLWAIVGLQNPPANFGSKIRIKIKE